jgi:hypothetical protein
LHGLRIASVSASRKGCDQFRRGYAACDRASTTSNWSNEACSQTSFSALRFHLRSERGANSLICLMGQYHSHASYLLSLPGSTWPPFRANLLACRQADDRRIDPDRRPETKAHVERFLVNPNGEIDGVILDGAIEAALVHANRG